VPRALLSSTIKPQPYQQPVALEWIPWAAPVHSSHPAHFRQSALGKLFQKSHDIHGSFLLVSVSHLQLVLWFVALACFNQLLCFLSIVEKSCKGNECRCYFSTFINKSNSIINALDWKNS
jgi:hypothetical protein